VDCALYADEAETGARVRALRSALGELQRQLPRRRDSP
jgi:hypothetical protein